MKKKNVYILMVLLTLLPVMLLATDWSIPDGTYFRYQRNLFKNLDQQYTQGMATISFSGQLFNFKNYQCNHGNCDNGNEIIIDRYTNSGGVNVTWSASEVDDDISSLSNLYENHWQPAPVVFNSVLYLFVVNKKGNICYSVYNAGSNTWSKLTDLGYAFGSSSGAMSAVVVNDHLSLVYCDKNMKVAVLHTSDLKTWENSFCDDLSLTEYTTSLSVVTRPYWNNGVRKEKALFGWTNSVYQVCTAEFTFDQNGSFQFLKLKTDITNDGVKYASIALAVGTIVSSTDMTNGDHESSGDCVQAFLQVWSRDNSYERFRIKRVQLKDDVWTKRQNNLGKQNYEWSGGSYLNPLTVTIVPVTDGKNIRQFMCLAYLCWDDNDWSLTCGIAETDKLIYKSKGNMDLPIMAGPENTQYIGYFEGAPPFHVNDSLRADPYFNESADPLSIAEFNHSTSTTTSGETAFDIGAWGELHRKDKLGIFQGTLDFKGIWGTEKTTTQKMTVRVPAGRERKGVYITLRPKISRAQYNIQDWQGNLLDSTYYFYISTSELDTEDADLKAGLNPAHPETYTNLARNINFALYHDSVIGSAIVKYTGVGTTGQSIATESVTFSSQEYSATLKIGIGNEDFWGVGVDGSFDYTLKSKSIVGNELYCETILCEPNAGYPKDIKLLKYTLYWMNPFKGEDNWWLHDSAKTQNTWCVTYDVTDIEYIDYPAYHGTKRPIGATPDIENNKPGTSESVEGSTSIETVSPTGFSLSQNYPNPFSPVTKIKYQVGIEDLKANTTNQKSLAKLVVYDLSGAEVATLVNENKAPGNYEVEWNASLLTPGVYFYSLQSGNFKDVKKLVLLK